MRPSGCQACVQYFYICKDNNDTVIYITVQYNLERGGGIEPGPFLTRVQEEKVGLVQNWMLISAVIVCHCGALSLGLNSQSVGWQPAIEAPSHLVGSKEQE